MIYFITDGIHTKIGKSNNPKRRLLDLQTANPNRLKVKYIFDVDDKYEKILHQRLKNYKTESNNEWFKFDDGLVDIKIGRLHNPIFKDLKLAKHKANLINSTIYIDLSKTRIIKGKSLTKGKRKRLLDDIRKKLKQKGRLSYKPYIKKYGFTFNEIKYFVKSAGLSKNVYNHNNKIQ